MTDETYGEANFPLGPDATNVRRGRHYHADIHLAVGDDPTHEALWSPFRTALTASGWTVTHYFDQNPPSATLHYQKGGKDAWAELTMIGGEDIRLDLVEVAPYTPTLMLTRPAAAPETIGDGDPFPYVKPATGTFAGTGTDNGPLYITLKGDEQPTLISPTSVAKSYSGFTGMSTLQFMLEFRNALSKAGWEIVQESQGLNQTDAVLAAHYAHGARDIWTSLHFNGDLAIAVADLSGDLAASLAKSCHLPLYGITFAFNKATLRPESESTLQRVLAALQGAPTLNVEVQGHTDNVGGDAYNAQLSQARAEAVRAWLTSHGVAATRLTAKGYGRTQPVADNGSDEGRAKNRRVELAAAGCK